MLHSSLITWNEAKWMNSMDSELALARSDSRLWHEIRPVNVYFRSISFGWKRAPIKLKLQNETDDIPDSANLPPEKLISQRRLPQHCNLWPILKVKSQAVKLVSEISYWKMKNICRYCACVHLYIQHLFAYVWNEKRRRNRTETEFTGDCCTNLSFPSGYCPSLPSALLLLEQVVRYRFVSDICAESTKSITRFLAAGRQQLITNTAARDNVDLVPNHHFIDLFLPLFTSLSILPLSNTFFFFFFCVCVCVCALVLFSLLILFFVSFCFVFYCITNWHLPRLCEKCRCSNFGSRHFSCLAVDLLTSPLLSLELNQKYLELSSR